MVSPWYAGQKGCGREDNSIDEYRNTLVRTFPGDEPAVIYQNIAGAIVAFGRTLITPGLFDEFMNGDADAPGAVEQRGLDAFIKADCKSYHDGRIKNT
jgi:cytochrome c peroxidase